MGRSDGFGVTGYGLSPFLHSKGLGLVSAFLRELACLENSILEPEFSDRALQVRVCTLPQCRNQLCCIPDKRSGIPLQHYNSMELFVFVGKSFLGMAQGNSPFVDKCLYT